MAVGFKVGSIVDELGSADFVYAFFSTIAARLDPSWGARFPVLMTRLYGGELQHAEADAALIELTTVRTELAGFAPDQAVWNFEDRSQSPPWGSNIASTITDLSNYFVTSTGRDLIATLTEAIKELRDRGGVGRIVSY